MTESEIKNKAYKAAKAKKIIDSITANCSNDEIIAWGDSAFFSNFDSPHEHVARVAKEFNDDATPF